MDWLKYRFLYLLISGTVLICSFFGVAMWGLKFGIDFTGGTLIEYRMPNGEKVTQRYGQISQEELGKIRSEYKNKGATEERLELVGPTIGSELTKKTIYGLLLSSLVILLWISIQFKNIKFGVSAILATLHDALVLIGVYSILGHFYGAEIDFLFVTALLTVVSFSVHDTIVVYDRIREMRKHDNGLNEDIKLIANKALTQTMVRSINNSFTIVFMLVALILMGGETVKWFSVALLIGTISGTYSSPFVAVPILVTWDQLKRRKK